MSKTDVVAGTKSANGSRSAVFTKADDSSSVTLPPYDVSRRCLLQANVNAQSEYDSREKKFSKRLADSWHRFKWLRFLFAVVPVLQWLPHYRPRRDALGDLFSGITVAVMHIPQGMAYGLLAGVTPSAGLYMAVFPTLIYFLFGTSRHISVGTLSIVSVMTLKLVHKHATSTPAGTELSATTTIAADGVQLPAADLYTPNEVVTATAIVCGLQMVLMSVLQLGSLAALLSESLVNGFTTGAAVHVLSSQLKDIFGVKIAKHDGYFNVIYTVIDICRRMPKTNIYALGTTAIVIAFMVIMNELVKPRFMKLCRFPIPAELIAVCGGTLVSYLMQLGKAPYNVHLVGNIPIGFPVPTAPPVALVGAVALDALSITIVSYSVTMSMAKILAKKHNYEVRPNQELLAMGLSNLFGGFFMCLPNGTSLSRSLIQEQTGGKTQLASVVSAVLIIFVLLWIAPVFEVLPRCVLSGIIACALKGMYMQAFQLCRIFRESKLDGLTWVVTFTAVVLVDVDLGLLVGVAMSLITVYIKGWNTSGAQLGRLAGVAGVYVDMARHRAAEPVPGCCIYRHTGALNFAFLGGFRRSVYRATNVTSSALMRVSEQAATMAAAAARAATAAGGEMDRLLPEVHTLILDLSAVSAIDVAALKAVRELERDMQLVGMRLVMAGPSDRVFETVQHAEWLGVGKFVMFASVHDAVLSTLEWAKAQRGEATTASDNGPAKGADDA